jgi:hypothetical protein
MTQGHTLNSNVDVLTSEIDVAASREFRIVKLTCVEWHEFHAEFHEKVAKVFQSFEWDIITEALLSAIKFTYIQGKCSIGI